MTDKKFIFSVADAYGYNIDNGNLVFRGITLINSNTALKLAAQEVRGGKNAALQTVFYHSPDLTFTVEDSQWNLDMISSAVNSEIQTNNDVYVTETVTLVSGAGTVTNGTPLTDNGSGTIYGWVTFPDNSVSTVVFSGSNFTTGSSNDTVCVRYFANSPSSRSVTIATDFIPQVVRLILEMHLTSPDETNPLIGKVQIIVPKCTLDGMVTINLKMDGVATTPIGLKALSYTDPNNSAGCSTTPYYAKIIEIVDNLDWWTGIQGISILGGDFALATTTGTRQLVVKAIPASGAPFIPPAADLTWASSDTGKATVVSGLVQGVATGTSNIHVTVTSAPTFDATQVCTVPA